MNDEVTTHSRIDGEPTAFGHGWHSGMMGIVFGIIGLGTVLCFRFPDLLTTPQIRAHYPLETIRALLHLTLASAFLLGAYSVTARGRWLLGGTAMALTLAAALMGGSRVPLSGSVRAEGPFLGLDWFLLHLIFWSPLFIPLERLFAHRPEQPVFRRGWRTDLSYFFVSALILQFTTYATIRPATVLFHWAISLPIREWVSSQQIWLQVIEIVLVADLMQYTIHRLFHEIPWLWRFHAIHHSVEEMDWLAGSRLHLVDVVLTRGITYIPIFILGFRDPAIAIYVVIVSIQATFIHANVRFGFGPLRFVVATPQFHHWHHSSEQAAHNKNFSVHVPLWDILFGTFYLPRLQWPRTYGLNGETVPSGFISQFVHPFQSNTRSVRDRTEVE